MTSGRGPALAAGRDEPALDVAAVDGDVALLGLGQLDVRQRLLVERRHPAWLAADAVPDPDVGQLGRRSAEVGRPDAAAGHARLIERNDVLMAVRQPLELPVGRRDPPDLVGPGDRGEERQPGAIVGRDEAGSLAGDDVAVHPGARHDVVTIGEVPAAIRAGIRAVRGQEPDVATVAVGGHPAAERGNGLAVREPSGAKNTDSVPPVIRVRRPVSTPRARS